MISEDIHETLREYFRWARIHSPENIGYPRTDPVRVLCGSSVASVGLSDEEAEYVDQAIGHLKQVDPDSYEVIKLIYRDQRSLRWMEKAGVGDRRTTSHLASKGTEFIRGTLFGVRIAS